LTIIAIKPMIISPDKKEESKGGLYLYDSSIAIGIFIMYSGGYIVKFRGHITPIK
jgi:hypothetical protein